MAIDPHQGTMRVLSRKLREIMEAYDDTGLRLEHVVTMIASTLVTDVCSLYEVLPDQTIVLRATCGLRPDAVGVTRYGLAEGLQGLVVRTSQPLNLADATEHECFSHRPDTGEEPFNSFLGVPLVRRDRVLGVLVIQNMVSRRYADSEIEGLQNIGTVVAEILVASPFKDDRRNKIFLSYRRQDSIHFAGRLFDSLASDFGSSRVYFDLDAIPFGVDFKAHIKAYLKSTGVMLALIGPRWASAEWKRFRPFSRPREDFVVTEIESAFEDDIPVIPVLIDAEMPKEEALPPGIRKLTRLNAAAISSGRNYRSDVETLTHRIQDLSPDLRLTRSP